MSRYWLWRDSGQTNMWPSDTFVRATFLEKCFPLPIVQVRIAMHDNNFLIHHTPFDSYHDSKTISLFYIKTPDKALDRHLCSQFSFWRELKATLYE